MKQNSRALLLAFFLFSVGTLSAWSMSHTPSYMADTSSSQPETVAPDKYLAALDSLRKAYLDWKYEGGDTLSNPYLFQLLSSPTYYKDATRKTLLQPADSLGGPVSQQVEERTQMINALLSNVYASQPWLVQRVTDVADTLLAGPAPVPEAAAPAPAPVEAPAPAPAQAETFLGDMDAFHIKVKRPNFWTVKGNFNVQLQQTYISDNWYQGGDDSFSANGQFTIEANYNNKQRLTWDNKLEARLGFQTMERYSLSGRFKPTTDLLRLTSKVGVKAFSHWYYSLALQSWTQMTQAREYYDDGGVQRYRVASDFMSPFEAVLSLGMEYKLEKKRFTLGANLAPVAVNYKHVSRTLYKPNQTLYQKFGLDSHDRFDFGSTLTVNAKWAICKMLTWQGRLYFFTSYHRTTAEFENTLSLKVNKYLSTNLFLYPRFDDGVKRGENHGYFQFKEYLSFGLDVSF